MADENLTRDVIAIFGEATVKAALATLPALPADGAGWDEFRAGFDRLKAVSPSERKAVADTLTEPIRRTLARMILERDLMVELALSEVKR